MTNDNMNIALKNNKRVEASPGQTASCPVCGDSVVSKCGQIKVWHWAHKSADCDHWSEPESEWHKNWKNKFPLHWQEVVIGKHRADIKTPVKVIEIQSSNISSGDIIERERFYGDMIWILKGEDFEDNFELRHRGDIHTFRWKHPRKVWWNAKMPIFIDFQKGFFEVKKIHPQTPCGGYGKLIDKGVFIKSFHGKTLSELIG